METHSKEWRSLCETRFSELRMDCGQTADAGIVDVEEWRDWSEFETTPDQRRIEAYISRFNLRGKKILHIGVGNSGLAKRFHRKLQLIIGTTVVPAELRKATSLGLPNYRVFIHNKYLGHSTLPRMTFHFVIDNNPTTFCCCIKHFTTMMEWYGKILEPEGQIVTDRVGLGWTTELEPENSRWKFTLDDLKAVAPFFHLSVYRINENIYVLSRGQPKVPKPASILYDLVWRLEQAILSRCRSVRGKVR